MKLVQIDKEKELCVAIRDFFPDAELTVIYDKYKELCEVRAKCSNGKIFSVRGGQCNGRIEMFFVSPPEKIKKHELAGTVLGMPFRKLFDSDFDARNAKSDLGQKVNLEEDAALEIKEVMVEESSCNMWTNNTHDFDMMEREQQLHEDRRVKYPNDLATAVEGPLEPALDLLADDREPRD